MSARGKTKERTFTTHIDISPEKRAALIETLNQHLADTLDLYTQVKQAHWNVKGKDFYQLHLLFDEIAEEIEPFIDLLAERATLLGGYATGTARMAAEQFDPPRIPHRRRRRPMESHRGPRRAVLDLLRARRSAKGPRATPTRSAIPPRPTSTTTSPGSPTSGSGSSRPTSRRSE